MASRSQAPFVSLHRFAPFGLRSRRYVKLPTLVRACQPSALPSRFASYVQSPVALLECWRSGLYQALRASFSLAASPCILYVPLPTLVACLLRSIALRGLPVRPPRGLPQNRANTCHLTAACWLAYFQGVFMLVGNLKFSAFNPPQRCL